MSLLGKLKGNTLNTWAWLKRVGKFKNLLSAYLSANKPTANGNDVALFVVMPWMVSAVPFFVILIGLFINRKGRKVHYVVDTFRYGKFGYLYDMQARSLLALVKLLASSYTVIDPKQLVPVRDGNLSKAQLENMATQCTNHFMKGELVQEGRQEYYDLVLSQLSAAEPYIHSVFKQNHYSYIYFPGGIHGTSCIYNALARRYNVRINTFDSDFGVAITSTNGIAAHFSDIPVAFNKVKSEITPDVFETLRSEVQSQIDQRSAGVDHFNTQVVDRGESSEQHEVGCLIVLNVSWDSAALDINGAFGSYHEWLRSTVRYILGNTSDHVTIRQHPHERFPLVKGSDDFETLLAREFNNDPRIHFVNCHAKVNTYSLINRSKFIVVFSSTSGIEAVLLNKPIVIGSRCYYSQLGFGYHSTSKEEYYNLLAKGSKGQLLLSEEQKRDAYICYYLGICCNLMFTDFTPVTTDFEKWVVRDGNQIFEDPRLQLYLHSIDANIPFSYLRYRELLKLN